MSFGQNFAYSKTKEQDIALMLAASVCHLPNSTCLYRSTSELKTAQRLWIHTCTQETRRVFTSSTSARPGKRS